VPLTDIQLGLRIGPLLPGPAPGQIMRALRGVEVSQGDSAPSGFQLTFLAEQVDASADDFAIVANSLLQPGQRVLIRVQVNGIPTTLIDGFVTQTHFVPANGPADSTFVVTGEDVSVKMDMVSYSREFPSLPDDLIVGVILAPWLAMGIVPAIMPTATGLVPYDHVPQQSGTDRATVQLLAAQNGYVFYVSPSSTPFTNYAYWGPPQRSGSPGAVLDVTVGPSSTVDSIQFGYDSLAPTTFFGLVLETTVDPYIPLPLLTVESTRVPALATQPALTPEKLISLQTRKELWQDQGVDPIRSLLLAQSTTDRSTDNVVTGTCEAQTTRLGQVVSAPGVVGVRGTGTDYDGLYYLKSAVHRMTLEANEQWDYRQTFTITREGVGTTVSSLAVS
jgi:hypothetical protein